MLGRPIRRSVTASVQTVVISHNRLRSGGVDVLVLAEGSPRRRIALAPQGKGARRTSCLSSDWRLPAIARCSVVATHTGFGGFPDVAKWQVVNTLASARNRLAPTAPDSPRPYFHSRDQGGKIFKLLENEDAYTDRTITKKGGQPGQSSGRIPRKKRAAPPLTAITCAPRQAWRFLQGASPCGPKGPKALRCGPKGKGPKVPADS